MRTASRTRIMLACRTSKTIFSNIYTSHHFSILFGVYLSKGKVCAKLTRVAQWRSETPNISTAQNPAPPTLLFFLEIFFHFYMNWRTDFFQKYLVRKY